MAGSKRPAKAMHEFITLLPSAARTADSGNGESCRLPTCSAVAFVLDASAAATDAGDILAVFVQTKIDGTNWVDVVAFTTVLGNGGAKRYVGKVSALTAMTMFENATALSAGSVRDLMGDEWRVRYTITDASTDNASFTFSVTAIPM